MSFKLTEEHYIYYATVSDEIVNLEAKKPFFFERCFALCNDNKFVAFKLTEVFRIGKLKVLRFVTEKGADISVPDTKNNTCSLLC